MTDLAFLGLAEAAERIRARKLSPVEYTKALLDRTAKLDGRYHAFIRLTPKPRSPPRARPSARSRPALARARCTACRSRLKDIIDVAGLPTTAHSKMLIDNVAAADAAVTARLEAAGGIMMGKLATHEFAIGGPSFDLPWPPARNPWNGDHFPGGSSSGSGVALAAGLFPAALGTDTGGSVRNPASMCGITGMKPTYGRVSRRGVLPLSFSLDHVGPMTRTVRDNALMLQVIAGHDPDDPGSADVPVPDYSAGLERGVQGPAHRLRAALLRGGHAGPSRAGRRRSRPRRECCAAAAPRCARSGCRRSPTSPPARASSSAARPSPSTAAGWRSGPATTATSPRQRILDGAAVSAADYVEALRLRAG